MLMFLSAFFSILFVRIVESGFLYGAPCSERNTAYLGLTRSVFPYEQVQCVDITGMGNQTTVIPFYNKIQNATVLYADHMHIKTIPKEILLSMPNLELIDFSGNNIRRIKRSTFLKTQNLQKLILSDNRVYIPKKYPLIISKSLTTLLLSNNKIKRLTPYTFVKVKSLTTLFLDRNELVYVDVSVFKPLKYLKYLHLGNNRLTRIASKEKISPSLMFLITKGNNITVYE